MGAALVICLLSGIALATGRTALAFALVGLVFLAASVILEHRRMSAVLWAGVALTAPLQGLRVVPALALSDVLIILAVLSIMPDTMRGWRRIVPAGVIIGFGVIVLTGLVGTFFAPDVVASLVNLFKIVLAAAGSVVAMVLWDPGRHALRRFAWLWFAGAGISALWASVTQPAGGRALGLTTHPNHFGLVCTLGVGLGLGLVLSSDGLARMAAVAGLMVLTVGIGWSGSRAAILGLAVTIAVAALLTRKFRLLVATGIVIVLAALALILGLVDLPESHALSRLVGGGASGASDIERQKALDEASVSIAQHPFTGVGFEFAQDAHNIYLQALVVGGPLALLGFLYVSGLILRAGLRGVHAQRGVIESPLVAGLTAGYAGYLTSGAFEPILWDRYLWTYIGLLLLLTASTGVSIGRQPSSNSGRTPVRAS